MNRTLKIKINSPFLYLFFACMVNDSVFAEVFYRTNIGEIFDDKGIYYNQVTEPPGVAMTILFEMGMKGDYVFGRVTPKEYYKSYDILMSGIAYFNNDLYRGDPRKIIMAKCRVIGEWSNKNVVVSFVDNKSCSADSIVRESFHIIAKDGSYAASISCGRDAESGYEKLIMYNAARLGRCEGFFANRYGVVAKILSIGTNNNPHVRVTIPAIEFLAKSLTPRN